MTGSYRYDESLDTVGLTVENPRALSMDRHPPSLAPVCRHFGVRAWLVGR
jgi:hypothetical protein